MSDIVMYNPNDEMYIKNTLLDLKEIRKSSDTLIKGVVKTVLDGVTQDYLLCNIVTGRGRIFTSQKIFNQKFYTDEDYRSWTVSYFGFGQGGAVIVQGGSANIISPDGCDQDLYDPVPMCDANAGLNYLTSPGDEYKAVSPTQYVAKPLGSNVALLNSEDLTCQYGGVHTYVRCSCIKAIGEPNYLQNDTDYVIINEAALYYSNLIQTKLFAHICFPPQYVMRKSEFVIEWFLLC